MNNYYEQSDDTVRSICCPDEELSQICSDQTRNIVATLAALPAALLIIGLCMFI